MRIEIQLTRLTPDLTVFRRIVRDPNSSPLAHFNAAYCLQDWISPEHAVYPFELLLAKINNLRTSYYSISQDPNEIEHCQKHNNTMITNTAHLKKIIDATAVIVRELELRFYKNTNCLPKLTGH